MRTYSQEDWDTRETEWKQHESSFAKLAELRNWFENDPNGVGQRAWKAVQLVAKGQLDPDNLSPQQKSDASALEKKVAELEAMIEETAGRSELSERKAEAKKALAWANDDHIKKGVEYFAKFGSSEMSLVDAIKIANEADYLKAVQSQAPAPSTTKDDAIRGSVDTSGDARAKISADPRSAARDIDRRIEAAIASVVGGQKG